MNEDGYHPLFDDILGGDVAAVESFLQTPGADVDFICIPHWYASIRYTPLNWAIEFNHKTIVEVLLAHGAVVNGPDDADKTPLQAAGDSDSVNEDTIQLLLDHGADVDAMTAEIRQTPLTLACCLKTNVVQLLLNAGADVNGGGGDVAPLHRATEFGNTEAIELLIEAGADVNRYHGSTPLQWAAYRNQLGCLNTLLAAGANPTIVNIAGENPLHYAARRSSVDVITALKSYQITALLAAGCDPLHQDNQGRTPLHFFYKTHNGEPFSAYHFNTITALVAAGDCSWQCVPTPCPGLKAAMVSVWQTAPDEMHELFKRLDDEMKKVVQEVLRVLHHHFSGFPHLKEHLLNSIFGFRTSV